MKNASCTKLLLLVSVFVFLSRSLSAATYYVDYVGGLDSNAGTTSGLSWKHCPGDTSATGVALAATLAAGDTVIFKGGVEYPGSLALKWSGATGNPITFDGNTAGTFGTGSAVFSGATHIAAAAWTRCTSSADAGGAPDWSNCFATTIASGLVTEPFEVNLYYDGNQGVVARMPNATDTHFWDDLTTYAVSPTGNTNTAINLTAGFPVFTDPAAWNGAYVGVWNNGNAISMVPITSTSNSGATINFSMGSALLHSSPSATFAIFNHPSLLDVPGEYVLTNSGTRIIFYAGSGGSAPTDTQISARRFGLNLNNKSHYVIQGMTFRNYSGVLNSARQGEGIAAWNTGGATVTDILIQNCTLKYNEDVGSKGGAISLAITSGVTIDHCTINENQGNRAMIFATATNATATNNSMDRNGATACDFYGTTTGVFRGNTITNNTGLHANGVTCYLECSGVTISQNIILSGEVSCTLQSAHNIDVNYNVFNTDVSTGYCVAVWPPTGTASDTITLRNNTCQIGNASSGRWESIRCDDTTVTNLRIYNNVLDGSVIAVSRAVQYQNDLYTHMDSSQSGWSELNFINATGLSVMVNPAAKDYHLVPGSPAIDKGISWGQTEDLEGNPIIGLPDIGAYEYQSNRTVLAGGKYHSIALKDDGTVWTWGLNSSGQLGNGTTTSSSTPTQLTTISSATSVAAGENHSLVLKSDGTVWAFGINTYGQLGNGTTTNSSTPVQVTGLTGIIAIAAGEYHSMALKSDGTLWIWGQNTFGQLGLGVGGNKTTATQVTGISSVSKIAGGGNFSAAVKSDGTVWTWGYNTNGQLGNNSTTASNVPVSVSGVSNVNSIACGFYHVVCSTTTGAVYAWGDNSNGQVGDGTVTNRLVPTAITSISGVSKVAAGSLYSKALTTAGAVYDWGSNAQGELADNTTTDEHAPELVASFTVSDIGSGQLHGLHVKADGTVWDVGYNLNGQIGDGTITTRKLPVQALSINLN